MKIRKFFGHLRTVNRHRFLVFRLCCKAGIPLQGLAHDLSKYSFTEFWEGVKYYNKGTYSPIKDAKRKEGYSKAWLHHKGRNKHHYEYWYDYNAPNETPVMPFKYFLELICDSLAAGMTYQGKRWNQHYQLKYWNRVKSKAKKDKKMFDLIEEVYTEVNDLGLDKVLNKKNLKELYHNYIDEEEVI